jgi:hypothetical protein
VPASAELNTRDRAFPPDLQALWDAAVKLQELQELHHKGEQ